MDELFRLAFDNSSDLTHGIPAVLDSTVVPLTTARSPARQTVPAGTVAAVGLVVCAVGSCANSVVLAVLVRARRRAGSSVHTLIANQSAIDLYACIVGMASLVMMIKHGYRYNGNAILDGAICVIFEDEALPHLKKDKEKTKKKMESLKFSCQLLIPKY